MKVLLFVQRGDARPKCEYTLPRSLAWESLAEAIGDADQTADPPTVASIAASADRWLLVECKNAEAGRTLIYLRETISAAHRYMGSKNPEQGTAAVCGSVPTGRILASGGKPRHR